LKGVGEWYGEFLGGSLGQIRTLLNFNSEPGNVQTEISEIPGEKSDGTEIPGKNVLKIWNANGHSPLVRNSE